MVLTALDRRHTLAVMETSAGRSGQWTWTRHEGGGRAGENWRKKEQRHIYAAEGVVSKSPGGEPEERRGRRPLFCFWQKQKDFRFLFGTAGRWRQEREPSTEGQEGPPRGFPG